MKFLYFLGTLFVMLLIGIIVFFINPILWVLGSATLAYIVADDYKRKKD